MDSDTQEVLETYLDTSGKALFRHSSMRRTDLFIFNTFPGSEYGGGTYSRPKIELKTMRQAGTG